MSGDCVFCQIVSGQLKSKFIYEGKTFVAFHDIEPKAPTHVLLVPREHIPSLQSVTADQSEMLTELFTSIPTIAEQLGLGEKGYKVVINTGTEGGQTVPHLHVHILGGKQLPQMF